MAEWLNTAFSGLDGGVFFAMNGLAKAIGGFLTPVCEIYTSLGDGGIFFILLSIAFMFFKKTRKTGIAMLLAIGVGAVFTNLTIKKLVARPRPYVTSETYRGFWEYVGAHVESEFSFPSGHTTSAMAAMTAMFICSNKKWSWVCLVAALFMGFTRLYFIVHYFTDVVGGLVIGAIGGVCGYYLSKLAFKYLEKYKEKKIIGFILNFCSIDLAKKIIAKIKKKDQTPEE